MRCLMILTIGVCLLFASVPAMADQAADEAAIRKVVEQINAAFNEHDASAMFSFMAENYENAEGRGRAAGEKAYSAGFEQQKDIQAKLLDEIGIQFVTPDVAIYKARWEETGEVGEDGEPLPPRKYLGVEVFVKKDGKWLSTAYSESPIEP